MDMSLLLLMSIPVILFIACVELFFYFFSRGRSPLVKNGILDPHRYSYRRDRSGNAIRKKDDWIDYGRGDVKVISLAWIFFILVIFMIVTAVVICFALDLIHFE